VSLVPAEPGNEVVVEARVGIDGDEAPSCAVDIVEWLPVDVALHEQPPCVG